MRLKDRVAIVVGAGQSPGEGMGNGRATAITFAREGASVLCVDRNLASAQETAGLIEAQGGQQGGKVVAFEADVTKERDIKAMVEEAAKRWGRLDILHNNVGVSLAGGDAELLAITEQAIDNCVSTSRAAFSRRNTRSRSCGNKKAAPSSTSPRWRRSRSIPMSPTRPPRPR
jgi:NAD(P)-dependent dehydrogenase (short-subunit alcohol dehydrogenase family)